MAEYTITKVSQIPPRKWSFAKGGKTVELETYKVMLGGIDEPVQLNRQPGNTPKVGDLLSGTLEDTEYGKKFKPVPKPFAASSAYTPKDSAEIKAMWAIGQAVEYVANPKRQSDPTLDVVETIASDLFLMVERIKDKGRVETVLGKTESNF